MSAPFCPKLNPVFVIFSQIHPRLFPTNSSGLCYFPTNSSCHSHFPTISSCQYNFHTNVPNIFFSRITATIVVIRVQHEILCVLKGFLLRTGPLTWHIHQYQRKEFKSVSYAAYVASVLKDVWESKAILR